MPGILDPSFTRVLTHPGPRAEQAGIASHVCNRGIERTWLASASTADFDPKPPLMKERSVSVPSDLDLLRDEKRVVQVAS
jgi:hypothetical protein